MGFIFFWRQKTGKPALIKYQRRVSNNARNPFSSTLFKKEFQTKIKWFEEYLMHGPRAYLYFVNSCRPQAFMHISTFFLWCRKLHTLFAWIASTYWLCKHCYVLTITTSTSSDQNADILLTCLATGLADIWTEGQFVKIDLWIMKYNKRKTLSKIH